MKVYELAKELQIESKELLDTLNALGHEVKSHNARLTEAQADAIKNAFESERDADEIEETIEVVEEKIETVKREPKNFEHTDMIPCRCVKPNKTIWCSRKTQNRYEWSGFGDVVEVSYADLLTMKASKDQMLFNPKIVIEDEDLVEKWSRELTPIYKIYAGLDYPEKLFEMNNVLFRARLQSSPKVIGELVKITATKMIKDGTFNRLDKLRIIDEVLGTCLKDFI